jgi:hypothetical protein
MRDFRLPPRCRRYLRSSGMLRSVEWWFCTDVSGQRIGPVFKGQEAQVKKMGLIGCPETSVQNYRSTLRGLKQVLLHVALWLSNTDCLIYRNNWLSNTDCLIYRTDWLSNTDCLIYREDWLSYTDCLMYRKDWLSNTDCLIYRTDCLSNTVCLIYRKYWLSNTDCLIYRTDWNWERVNWAKRDVDEDCWENFGMRSGVTGDSGKMFGIKSGKQLEIQKRNCPHVDFSSISVFCLKCCSRDATDMTGCVKNGWISAHLLSVWMKLRHLLLISLLIACNILLLRNIIIVLLCASHKADQFHALCSVIRCATTNGHEGQTVRRVEQSWRKPFAFPLLTYNAVRVLRHVAWVCAANCIAVQASCMSHLVLCRFSGIFAKLRKAT